MLNIIHIIENLDRGAVENWLVRTFLESRKMRPSWKWTFYCTLGKEGSLDEVVRAAGAEIIYAPYWVNRKIKFLQHLRSTLKKGRYDIIHSHHDYLSGFYLVTTAGIPFKKRILHIHNTDKSLPVGNRRLHDLLLPVFKKSAIFFSDVIVGISKNTLSEFTNNKPLKKKATCILYYGVNLESYKPVAYGNENFHKELNLPVDARTLLFAGRINALKNPAFVVDVLDKLAGQRKDVYAIFIGTGDEDLVISRARHYGIEDRVRMLGWRTDTADIMKMAGVFVFPRIEYPKEGLGLVVVEAQAAGLPMVLSKGIVEDAIEIKELTHWLPLNNNPLEWASVINDILNSAPPVNKADAYLRMQQSKFEMGRATKNFITLYE